MFIQKWEMITQNAQLEFIKQKELPSSKVFSIFETAQGSEKMTCHVLNQWRSCYGWKQSAAKVSLELSKKISHFVIKKYDYQFTSRYFGNVERDFTNSIHGYGC